MKRFEELEADGTLERITDPIESKRLIEIERMSVGQTMFYQKCRTRNHTTLRYSDTTYTVVK